ncbi:trmt10a [Symbiodinium sp. CCMP2592]|nr:trmt10a [Symbiodinium sp. CCMP2592]
MGDADPEPPVPEGDGDEADEEDNGEASEEAEDQEEETGPASRKSQKRKLKQEQKAEWKAAQKAKRKQKQQEKRGKPGGRRKGPPLPPLTGGKPSSPEEVKEARAARKAAELDDFRARAAQGATVVIDLEWEDSMQPKELKSLIQQVLYCYGANRRAEKPVRLVFSGIAQGSKTHAGLSKQSGYDAWEVQKLEGEYVEAFPKDKLVYLTADAQKVLHSFDPEKVYVIGGIVDRNRLKGRTLEKAQTQDIAAEQLPLSEHIEMGSYSRVLTVNHVLNMILDYQATNDWRGVCERCVPGRKVMTTEGEVADVEDLPGKGEPVSLE